MTCRSLLAITTRPNTPALALAIGVALLGWLALRRAMWAAAPPRPSPSGNERPRAARNGWMEPPAVVALLTNDYAVPPTAVTATMLDLASRGWIQLAYAGDEVVVFTRGNGQQGDVLRPFEQQVLNHLAGPDVRRRHVGRHARCGPASADTPLVAPVPHGRRRRRPRVRAHAGSIRTRATGRPGVRRGARVRARRARLAVRATTRSARPIRSRPRLVWIVGLVAAIALAVDTVRVYRSVAELPTDDGLRRSAKWLGYRARLLARIPDRASVVAPPEQQRALADACVMGVAEHVDRAVVGCRRGRAAGVERRRRHAAHRARALPHPAGLRPPAAPRHGRSA